MAGLKKINFIKTMEKIIIKCPQCGADMKYIPAGISKKGNPYKAFYSCSNCGYAVNAPEEKVPKAVSRPIETEQDRIERLAKAKQERIQQLHQEKKENINWTSAMKEAVHLVANHPLFKDLPDERTVWDRILYYRNLIYKEYTKSENNADEVKETDDWPDIPEGDNLY